MKSYLLGMEAKHKVTKEGFDEGERLFRKALEIDPQLARAYVGLAYIYEYRIDLGLGNSADNLAKLIEAARNAVRLDPATGRPNSFSEMPLPIKEWQTKRLSNLPRRRP